MTNNAIILITLIILMNDPFPNNEADMEAFRGFSQFLYT